MTYPKLLTTLFDDSGSGDKLNEEIIPDSVVKSTAQTLTDAEKTQARTNIDSQSATELTTALSDLITDLGGTQP